MAGLKRKEAPISNAQASPVSKKAKKKPAQVKVSKIEPSTLEAQTDSDPIIESDTTEHSGDDDGVSWPSDEEEGASQQPGNDEESTKKPVGEDRSIKKPPGTNDINGCIIDQPIYYRREKTDSRNSQVFQRSSCKAKNPGSRTQSGQTQRGFDSSNEENLGTSTTKITRSFCRAERVDSGAF